jgi:hypothetical protein
VGKRTDRANPVRRAAGARRRARAWFFRGVRSRIQRQLPEQSCGSSMLGASTLTSFSKRGSPVDSGTAQTRSRLLAGTEQTRRSAAASAAREDALCHPLERTLREMRQASPGARNPEPRGRNVYSSERTIGAGRQRGSARGPWFWPKDMVVWALPPPRNPHGEASNRPEAIRVVVMRGSNPGNGSLRLPDAVYCVFHGGLVPGGFLRQDRTDGSPGGSGGAFLRTSTRG